MSNDLPQRVKQFYELVSVDREKALEQLPLLYSDDVQFVNPVADKTGLQLFITTWQGAFKQYKLFEFQNIEVVGTEDAFALTYTMNLRFSFGPIFPSPMATYCLARNGKVYYCRDYFDPLGSLVTPFPPFNWLYRAIFSKLVA
jgi:hypothetical protein